MEIFVPRAESLFDGEFSFLLEASPNAMETVNFKKYKDTLQRTEWSLRSALLNTESMRGNGIRIVGLMLERSTLLKASTVLESVSAIIRPFQRYTDRVASLPIRARAVFSEVAAALESVRTAAQTIKNIEFKIQSYSFLVWDVAPPVYPPENVNFSQNWALEGEWREAALQWSRALESLRNGIETGKKIRLDWADAEESLLNAIRQVSLFQGASIKKSSDGGTKSHRPRSKGKTIPFEEQEVTQWWSDLSEGRKIWYLNREPSLIGNLAGIPFTVRGEANRNALGVALRQKSGLTPKKRRVVDALVRMLNSDSNIPISVIALDLNADVPLVAVAYGDPDRADHIAWAVPGMFNDADRALESWDEAMRAQYLKQRELLTITGRNSEEVSLILFQEYDTPNLFTVLGSESAKEGAERLVTELNGMAAVRKDNPRMGVIGHSYGTTVLSYALSSEGLNQPVDFVDLKASAGLSHQIKDISQLRVQPDSDGNINVFTTLAIKDSIAPVGSFLSGRLQPNFGTAGSYLPGAKAYSSDGFESFLGTSTHAIGGKSRVGYFHEDSQSLLNTAAITIGAKDLMVQGEYSRPQTGYRYEEIRDF